MYCSAKDGLLYRAGESPAPITPKGLRKFASPQTLLGAPIEPFRYKTKLLLKKMSEPRKNRSSPNFKERLSGNVITSKQTLYHSFSADPGKTDF